MFENQMLKKKAIWLYIFFLFILIEEINEDFDIAKDLSGMKYYSL